MRIFFDLIMAGSFFSLLAAPSFVRSQEPLSPMQAGAPGLEFLVAPRVNSAPDLDTQIAGLPGNSRPEVLSWERVFTLALVRFRAGDGRIADALVPSELAARAKRNGVDDFARFRTDFLASRAEARGTFRDPTADFLRLLRRWQSINSARRDFVAHEILLTFMRELVQGESGGLSQLDVDRVSAALERARQRLADDIGRFRNDLDQMKVALGLSPHAAIVPDRQILAMFGSVFEAVDNWFRSPNRNLAELHTLVNRVPVLGNVVVGGRRLRAGNSDTLDELLNDAARLAIKNRGVRNEGPSQEDAQIQLELRVRRQVRHLLETQSAYDGEKHSYELAARLKDQTFERLVGSTRGVPASRSALLDALLDHTTDMCEAEIRLVRLWTDFRSERLALYREIGTLPYDNWKSFYQDLSAEPAPAAEGPEAPGNTPAPPAGPLPAPPAPPTPPAPRAAALPPGP
ncbi:MAG: hypothetical protein ACLQIB_42250 [Isosphaeraceae bacterium]